MVRGRSERRFGSIRNRPGAASRGVNARARRVASRLCPYNSSCNSPRTAAARPGPSRAPEPGCRRVGCRRRSRRSPAWRWRRPSGAALISALRSSSRGPPSKNGARLTWRRRDPDRAEEQAGSVGDRRARRSPATGPHPAVDHAHPGCSKSVDPGRVDRDVVRSLRVERQMTVHLIPDPARFATPRPSIPAKFPTPGSRGTGAMLAKPGGLDMASMVPRRGLAGSHPVREHARACLL